MFAAKKTFVVKMNMFMSSGFKFKFTLFSWLILVLFLTTYTKNNQRGHVVKLDLGSPICFSAHFFILAHF